MGLTDKAIEILLGALLVAVLVFLGFQEVRLRHQIAVLNKSLDTEIQCRTGSQCASRTAAASAEGAVMVAQARADAADALARQKAQMEQQAADAVQKQRAASLAAKQAADEWQRKYQDALKSPDCATWAKQAVSCKIPD